MMVFYHMIYFVTIESGKVQTDTKYRAYAHGVPKGTPKRPIPNSTIQRNGVCIYYNDPKKWCMYII